MERTTISNLTARSNNVLSTKSRNVSQDPTVGNQSLKVLGRLCPSCGVAGTVLCGTKNRIVYECSNGHVFETRGRSDELHDEHH